MGNRILWRDYTVTESGCWHIPNKPCSNGYTIISLGGGIRRHAHRHYYELHKGPIPAGYTIDHLCRNRRCVNPAHLEAVTQRENTLRSPTSAAAVNARKTHCARAGHPLSGDNLFINANGARVCRACVRADQPGHNRRAYLRRKERV